jgi:dipeptidase E
VRLLMTSVGPTNDSIRKALLDLLGKPMAECRAVYVPTAIYALPSGPGDGLEMARYVATMGWQEAGLIELTALPSIEEEHWLPAFEAADAIIVGGGNGPYLGYWFEQSGLAARMPAALEEKVYLGISAGSCLLTPGWNFDRERLERDGIYYDDEYDEATPRGFGSAFTLSVVPFGFRPHLNADYFPQADLALMRRAAAKVDYPLYAVDDETALKVVDGEVEVVSEGQWKLFEK